MPRELVSKIFLLLVCLSFSPGPLFAFQASTTVIVHASKMTFSEKVDNVGDHVVFWGIATGENTWLAYSLKALPFKNFTLEVEAGADTAAGRWPNVGIAFNEPDNLETEFQVQSLTTTTFMQLGKFTPGGNDSIIYFVFTNDYWDPNKGHDVNLKLRNIRFTGSPSTIVPPTVPDNTLKIMDDSVRISWQPNTEPDLDGYKIHYGNASGSYSSMVDVEQETSHVLKLPINRTYFLAVTAYDTADNASSYSDEVVFYMASTTQIIPGDTVVVEEDSVTVRWDANSESDLAGYRIYYGSASSSYSDSITVGLTTSYVLNLSPNKTYFLAVKAYDQSDNLSEFSNEVVLSTAPVQPEINCDINEDGLVDLNDWLAFNASFDSNKGEQRFRENADFNKDGKIDNADQEIANTKCLNPWSGITNN
ncbi:fibronectin type III domain-containing protein [candidate division KSB1 bacterium]|nr:fibronectin type III domain-containing protein [candidate division KSB1 bacterium]